MEHVLFRFPTVAQQLFEELDIKSLVNCRNVNRTWQQFLDNQKFYWVQKVGILSKLPRFDWQNVFKQINNEVVGEFALVVSKFFQDYSRETKQTPMHFIAMVGNIKIANNYLRINCKIENIENGLGLTPLHYAARNGNLLICQLILSIVSDKNPRNSRGCTPYHNAARNGHLSVCKLFIDCIKDKNPHTGGIFGTPLHIVGQRGHYEICELILEHVSIKNPFLSTVLLKMGRMKFVSS